MLEWNKENRFAAFVAATSAAVFIIDLRHGVHRDGFLEPAWSMLLYVAFPLLLISVLEAKHRSRAAVFAILGLIGVVAVVSYWSWLDPASDYRIHRKVFYRDQYFVQHKIHMVYAAAICLGLALAAAKSGKTDLRKWGLGLGDWRWWVPRTGILILCIVPLIGLGAVLSPELREFYPEIKKAQESVGGLVSYQIGNGFYMAAWEWFFRGFLLFGIYRYWGTIPAILLQAYPFMIMHKTKPELEMAASFVGAILLGLFCLRARCFWPAFLLHWILNINMEIVGFIW